MTTNWNQLSDTLTVSERQALSLRQRLSQTATDTVSDTHSDSHSVSADSHNECECQAQAAGSGNIPTSAMEHVVKAVKISMKENPSNTTLYILQSRPGLLP